MEQTGQRTPRGADALLDDARRLELSGVEALDDRITGTLREARVELFFSNTGFTALAVDCGADLSIAEAALRVESSNDANEVVTGDGAFDDAVRVLATDRRTASAKALLDSGTRRALLDYLHAHPFAKLRGRWLHVPLERAPSTRDLEEARALAATLWARSVLVGQRPADEVVRDALAFPKGAWSKQVRGFVGALLFCVVASLATLWMLDLFEWSWGLLGVVTLVSLGIALVLRSSRE